MKPNSLRSSLAAALVAVVGLPLCLTHATEPKMVQAQTGMPIVLLRDWHPDLDRSGRRVVVLTDDWLYCYPPTGALYRVPRSYVSDFASIPPVARRFIAEFGKHAEAAVIHDWLYAVGEPGKREEADDLFRHAMAEQGVNVVTRNAMHRAVRSFGGGGYGAEREWRNFAQTAPPYARAEPPFARPGKAAVATVDCTELDERRGEWLGMYP